MCSRHPLTTDWLGAAGEESALEEGQHSGAAESTLGLVAFHQGY